MALRRGNESPERKERIIESGIQVMSDQRLE
jgi:hypothetical protein